MNYGFEGNVALVTGASGGIGRASALAFAASGASVVVSDVNVDGAAETVALISAAGGNAVFQRCDVSNGADVKALVARAVSEYGRLDFALNNAGINNLGANEYDDDVWARSMGINLTGVMMCMREEAEVMMAQGKGAIVNTASINGLVGNGAQPGYTASKHGVVGLTRHGALRWAQAGIRVNCVTPAAVKTAIFDQMTPEHIAFMLSKIPMGRFGTPEEVAAMVSWLCTEDCSFSTGAVFDLSGGRSTY
ncbi:MAG: SDR family oxidoreductase [Sphingomonadaceae bacterium]|nr:SDR family oxidoreductase [Sphingomonadaceae bacterium]